MIEITREKIDMDRLFRQLDDDGSGGVVVFVGRVRDHADGRRVQRMAYEGYEKMALSELEAIAETMQQRWPVQKLALVHRLGMLELGEVSVAVGVACAHRAEAFDACRFAIDTLKKRLPVWKKEYGPDGDVWVEGVIPETDTKAEEKPNVG